MKDAWWTDMSGAVNDMALTGTQRRRERLLKASDLNVVVGKLEAATMLRHGYAKGCDLSSRQS